MSSILRALKRLENEQPQKNEGKSWPQKIDTKKTIRQRVKGPLLFNRLVSMLFAAIILLAAGGWFISTYESLLMKRPSPSLPSPGIRGRKTKIASLQARRKSAGVQQLAPKTKTVPMESITSAEKKMPGPVFPRKVPCTLASTEKPEDIANKQPVVTESRVAPKESGESGFKLEAIVWSSNPKSRFAVINGRIVRAGVSIEGASVTRIAREYVAVRSAEQEWKLRLAREQ